jgi:hypothetical protein
MQDFERRCSVEYEDLSDPDLFKLFKVSPFQVVIQEVDEHNRQTVIALLRAVDQMRQENWDQ